MKIGDVVRVVAPGNGLEDCVGEIRDGRAGRGSLPAGHDWLVALRGGAGTHWFGADEIEIDRYGGVEF